MPLWLYLHHFVSFWPLSTLILHSFTCQTCDEPIRFSHKAEVWPLFCTLFPFYCEWAQSHTLTGTVFPSTSVFESERKKIREKKTKSRARKKISKISHMSIIMDMPIGHSLSHFIFCLVWRLFSQFSIQREKSEKLQSLRFYIDVCKIY